MNPQSRKEVHGVDGVNSRGDHARAHPGDAHDAGRRTAVCRHLPARGPGQSGVWRIGAAAVPLFRRRDRRELRVRVYHARTARDPGGSPAIPNRLHHRDSSPSTAFTCRPCSGFWSSTASRAWWPGLAGGLGTPGITTAARPHGKPWVHIGGFAFYTWLITFQIGRTGKGVVAFVRFRRGHGPAHRPDHEPAAQ